MSSPNTPRPFTYLSPPEEEFVPYEDPMPSSSAATTAFVGTSSVRRGRPILNTVTNIHREIEPLMVPVLSHSATSLPTLSVVPTYELVTFYATKATLEAQGAENHPEDARGLDVAPELADRLYTHRNPQLNKTKFIKVDNLNFKPNRFYPKVTSNKGSYFHEGYTFDQIIQMEKERKQAFIDEHYRKKSGGRRSSKYHRRQSKKQHGRKRTTRRR